MDFSGPERTDFANVQALNRAFLLKLRSPAAGRRLRGRIPEALRDAIEGLTDRQVDRLSASPFLLLSLREHNAEFWRGLEADSPVMDLFAPTGNCRDEIAVAAVSTVAAVAAAAITAAAAVAAATTEIVISK